MSDTYRVKPLEWKGDKTSATAESIFGDFEVALTHKGRKTQWGWVLWGYMNGGSCTSLADGKAKAEAFCRQRLMPALEVVE